MSHTEEPWNFHTYDGITHITDSNNNLAIARLTSYGGVYGASEANARRIVACINACAGLSTDDIEKTGLVSAVGHQLLNADKERDQLLELCGELFEALNKINEWKEFPATGMYWESGSEMCYETCYGSNGARDYMRNIARQAITKAEKALGGSDGIGN